MALLSAAISLVAVRECSASLRTSSATTANPRPASPARAASMAALSANRLVCSVMSLMTLMISEISSERSPSDLIFLAVACTEARMRCMPSSVSRTERLPCSAASSARRAASALASALLDTCFIEIVSGIELHARAIFPRAQLLAEIGELFHWPDDFDVEHVERESRAQHDQQAAEQHLKTTGAAKAVNE